MVRQFPKQLAALLLLGLMAWPAAAQEKKTGRGTQPVVAGKKDDRVSVERAGTVVTRDGLKLRLVTEVGHVVVLTTTKDLAPGHLRYHVRILVDRRQPDAQKMAEQFVVSARNTFLPGNSTRA